MLNIVFSIPIHQKLEVVLDQICNIQHFNPNCGIVFHMSKGFDYKTSLITKEYFLQKVKQLGNVFINPESVRTGFADIIQAHISNFDYVSKVCDFHYFAICASNESFIRPNLYDHLKQVDCGYRLNSIEKASEWKYGEPLFRDQDLLGYLKANGYNLIDVTTPEGQYFRKDIMMEVVETIKHFYNYLNMKEAYPREEVYFSTVARNLFPNAKVGKIFTYSAYHYQFLWDVTRSEINRLIHFKGDIYSVKRVNRQLNDNIRVYLRDKFKYDGRLSDLLPNDIDVKDRYTNLRIDMSSVKKNIKELMDNWKKIPKYFTNKWK